MDGFLDHLTVPNLLLPLLYNVTTGVCYLKQMIPLACPICAASGHVHGNRLCLKHSHRKNNRHKPVSFSTETETFSFSIDVLTSCGWWIFEYQYLFDVSNTILFIFLKLLCITFAISTKASVTESLWMKVPVECSFYYYYSTCFQPSSTVYCLNLNSSKMIHDYPCSP